MITNFDYLKEESDFLGFADVAIAAERIILMDPEASIMDCRRAMEFAIKWMYSVDNQLEMPYQDNLKSLMDSEEFRQLIGYDLWKRLKYIRIKGNDVAHSMEQNAKKVRKKAGRDEAMLCLENLFIFLDYIACCYGKNYVSREFDSGIIEDRILQAKRAKEASKSQKEEMERQKRELEKQQKTLLEHELNLKKLMEENAALKEALSARREEQQSNYVPKPLELTEYKTRKLYIDAMLLDAGWIEGENWLNEYEIPGMPNRSEVGFADYVLLAEDRRVLAVIEAKRTCVDVSKGRQQAKLYADLIEKAQGYRPVVFLTNGFETRLIDHQYPERKVSSIYSKRDLEKWFNLQKMRTSLAHVSVNKEIAGRYYQEAAIKAVCRSLDEKNRRKALIVMATGAGKTRTVIGLVDVLLQHGWIKNVLFLADRNSLVTQAKRNFSDRLSDLSVTNLCEDKDNYNARCVFSTYQTMMNCIDSIHDEEGKLFTCGHFDLVICDEAHRSIYNKYKDIFTYFDAPLVGLTATPKRDMDKNTYDIFELQNGVPTYGYELAQAVKDGYLVDFISVETTLKFLQEGISYEDLSEEEKEEYENTFRDADGELPESISSSALNEWVFNEDTIKEVLHVFMTNGLKVDYGNKIGKSIIFAKNHKHAEKIFEIFNREYPHLKGYAKVIDNYINYAQSAIDEFSDAKKLPQIAISVDMLDTGIDIPEVLNLVFFKKVMSKAKFWQMVGRGTRLCPGLLDGQDKTQFYIFDFCGNFEFFRMNKNGRETANMMSVQSAIFQLEFEIAYKLQDLAYQTERLITYRNHLVEHMVSKVRELNRENFAVKQHLKYVDLYSDKENYKALTLEDTQTVREELTPFIEPENEDAKALRFDALMYGIELAYLVGKKYGRAKGDLLNKVAALSEMATIPEIMAQEELLNQILHTDYLERAEINEFEHIREKLRDLMKYITNEGHKPYSTHFEDQILDMQWKESELESDDLKDYKAKAEYYIQQNLNHQSIAKLRSNIPLTMEDIKALEEIMWSDLGTKSDYEAEYGQKPLGELVREIVGMDMNAAKEAFAEYLDETSLDSRQIYFVNQIVEFIVHNGVMKDLSVLQEAPFSDQGSIVDIFTDLSVWMGIRRVIEQVNANAGVAA